MSERALVLGGGGITGIAWETGLLAGLAEAGVDLTTADRVVGTSAGSIVGAQITSDIGLEELYRRQLLSPAELGDTAPLASIGPSVALRFAAALLRARGDVERFGRILGRQSLALSAKGRTPTVAERYQQVAQRIGGLQWPDRDLVVTAVDAATGELAAFGPRGPFPDVSLEDAVNASCAVPCVYPPIPVGGRVLIDGGVRSGANADLAAGCDPVVVLAPLDRSVGLIRSAAQQLTELGVRHVVITPDATSLRAIGKNVLDPAARPPSARAGRAQAAAHVDELRALWG
ncbi:patatin-like phospholipase family protein [Nocardioides rubriscoriae]|uniref:patatin-like phospholipase family protein n=1 Tax=Nocardioides rubriscoriae TaxID=642762 RepID=UPI0011DF6E57|nr:patatin-like phospholipase family protein [Nocardioides rubriscoriae]